MEFVCIARFLAGHCRQAVQDQVGDSTRDVVIVARPRALKFYGQTCGWTLARAHARSGDPVAIAACLGGSDVFDRAVTDFSHRYADQNERDYEEFVKAIHSGRLEAREGV